jgi:hypothetical protein
VIVLLWIVAVILLMVGVIHFTPVAIGLLLLFAPWGLTA